MAYSAHKYLSNLTTLRGIAAIWVFVFHFSGQFFVFIPPSKTHLLDRGYLMVDLFFIMSGFIITHVYQKRFKNGIDVGSFRNFFVARFARIYPLHFVTLIVVVLYAVLLHQWDLVFDPNAIATNVLLIHSFGIHKVFTWNVPSWSISAEWWAYMAFPALIVFISRWKKTAIVVLGIFAVVAYVAMMFWLPRHDPFDPKAIVPHNLDVNYDFGFLRGLAGFISGMILYKIYEYGYLNKFFKKDITALIIITASIVALHFGINDGWQILLFVFLVMAFALNEEVLHKLCNFKAGQFIGNISYSIYLNNVIPMLFNWYFNFRFPGVTYTDHGNTAPFWLGLGYCAGMTLLLIGFSTLTYFGIEKPCRKYINARWGKETMPVYAKL